MNIEQLANKIEHYANYSWGRDIILELERNDEASDWSIILKQSNGMCIIGTADWGDYDDFSFKSKLINGFEVCDIIAYREKQQEVRK